MTRVTGGQLIVAGSLLCTTGLLAGYFGSGLVAQWTFFAFGFVLILAANKDAG